MWCLSWVLSTLTLGLLRLCRGEVCCKRTRHTYRYLPVRGRGSRRRGGFQLLEMPEELNPQKPDPQCSTCWNGNQRIHFPDKNSSEVKTLGKRVNAGTLVFRIMQFLVLLFKLSSCKDGAHVQFAKGPGSQVKVISIKK